MLLADTSFGSVFLNQGSVFPAWHGGATMFESEVPMIWHYPGFIFMAVSPFLTLLERAYPAQQN